MTDSPAPALADLDVALAHWHVNAWGGAEYLVTELADALDVDTVYTVGDPSPDEPNPYGDVRFVDVVEGLRPRPLRRLQARAGRVFEYALWEDVDWRDHGHPDVLVTSGGTTRAVITPDDTLHVNYCHSPPRWFYDLYHDRKDSPAGLLARPLVRHLRTRDAAIDPRVDRYFANSPVVARRLRKYYDRDATVLYPPVDLAAYRAEGDAVEIGEGSGAGTDGAESGADTETDGAGDAGASATSGAAGAGGADDGFYLHLGRLDEEKGIEAVVDAFAGTDRRLVLAGGEGDAGDRVRRRIDRAGNLDYRGFVAEDEKVALLRGCRALVFNGRNEDFGIVPIEANAAGRAVLARAEGFPAVYVEAGRNGYLHDGTAEGIRGALERFEREGVSDPAAGVGEFGREAFRRNCRATIERWYDEFRLTPRVA